MKIRRECSKEGIIRRQSPVAFFIPVCGFLHGAKSLAKHQRGHSMAPLRSVTGLDPAIRLPSSGKEVHGFTVGWPGSGPASLLMCYLQQLVPPPPPVGVAVAWGLMFPA